MNMISQRWLAIRLELVGNAIVFFAALFAVLSSDWIPASAGVIGLSLSYSMNVRRFVT